MTDPNLERLGEWATLVLDGVVTTGEVIARVRKDRELLAGATITRLAEDGWELAGRKRDAGCLVTGLLHEWTATHAGDDPAAVFASGRAFVRAATEVLIVRDDADLYRRAYEAADRMIAAAVPAAVPGAHYTAGMLHLAPYAIDPVNGNSDYAFSRALRAARERWSCATYRLEEQLMPEPAVGLGRAVHHLAAAAEGDTGETWGEVLAHLAFAEYSRHLASGSGNLSDVDRWCDESMALLPPEDEPLAWNRLLWLHIMRERPALIGGCPIVAPTAVMPNGPMYTVLATVTAVRLLSLALEANACRKMADIVWPLVAEDPDLQAQRLFLDLAMAHSLPGDPAGCRARLRRAPPTSLQERGLSGAAVAASRMHALMCGPGAEDPAAVERTRAAVRMHAPHLFRLLAVVVAHKTWMLAVRTLDQEPDRRVPALINAVMALAHTGYRDLAMMALVNLKIVIHEQVEEGASVDRDEVMPTILTMVDTVYAQLPEDGWRMAGDCLAMLLAHWAKPMTFDADWYVIATMNVLKGRALAAALAWPGPESPDLEVTRAVAVLATLGTDSDDRPGDASPYEVLGYLHGAEREPGWTVGNRRANVRRRAQTADMARLMARVSLAPFRMPEELLAALPDDAVLLNVCVGATAMDVFHGMVANHRSQVRLFSAHHSSQPTPRYVQTSLDPNDFGVSTRIYSISGVSMGQLHRALLEDPLHRDVTRAGARELAAFARYLPAEVLETLAEFATAGDRTRLIFWPHESLYFLPLHLLPFRDGILADRFTVTVLPSVECLFQRSETAAVHPGVAVIACAAGGLAAGLPEEPALHEQAERIAGLFGTRPLTGDDATPTAVLDTLGTSRYLHLAAHGALDADAPLFAHVYLAGRMLHAYEILERDLRGIELVTLSACESALLRYDFLDNLHGLAPAFLRAGARAVIGALWPVSPEVAATFFTELYADLAGGSTQVNAFRFAQVQTRTQHPNYRDWGAFTYFGS